MFQRGFKVFSKSKYFKPSVFSTFLFSTIPLQIQDFEEAKRKISLFSSLGNYKAIKSIAEQGLKNDPNNYCFLVYLFYSALLLGDREDLTILESRLEKMEPKSTEDLFYKAIFLFSTGNTEEGLLVVEESAKKGNPDSILELGKINYITFDNEKGYQLIKEAANIGHPFGRLALAELYLNSKKFKDYKKALEILKELEGEKELPYELLYADVYLQGKGVDKDEKKALEYLKKGSEKGDINAANYYANMMFKMKKYDESFKYFQKCYDNGQKDIISKLSEHYIEGLGHSKDVKRGFELLDEGMEKFYDAESMAKVGNYFMNGKYFNSNPEVSAELFDQCAQVENPYCKYLLAMCFVHGLGVPKNLDFAKKLLGESRPELLNDDKYLTHYPSEWKKEK